MQPTFDMGNVETPAGTAWEYLTSLPRWVTRKDDVFVTSDGSAASLINSSHWATHDLAAQWMKAHGGDGVAFALGPDARAGLAFCAVVVRGCRSPELGFSDLSAVDPDMLQKVQESGSYAEIGPDVGDLQLFGTYNSSDLVNLRKLMGPKSAWGHVFKRDDVSIELSLGHKFVPVTRRHLVGTPSTLQQMPMEVLEKWLLHWGPALQPAIVKTKEVRPSDTQLAIGFIERYADQVRYVKDWKQWHYWKTLPEGGGVWAKDRTGYVSGLVAKYCHEIAGGFTKVREANSIASARTVVGVEGLVRSDQRISVSGEIWNQDIYLLNTPKGIVDLTTGVLQPADPARYMTNITAVGPGGDCPTWIKFIKWAMKDNADMIAYLQRVAGVLLTGDTRDQSIFIAFGDGGNGKNTYAEALVYLLNDYARIAPETLLVATKFEQHSTEMAGLRGARLVFADESDDTKQLNEARIRRITGGSKTTSRGMGENFSEDVTRYKLLLTINRKTQLREVGENMRRRLKSMPFDNTVTDAERDLDLGLKMQAEAGGILAWAMQGCLDWMTKGLQPPKEATDATDEYLKESDTYGRWAEEALVKDTKADPITTAQLFPFWKAWAESLNYRVGNESRLGKELGRLGYERQRSKAARGFVGVRLKRDDEKEAPPTLRKEAAPQDELPDY